MDNSTLKVIKERRSIRSYILEIKDTVNNSGEEVFSRAVDVLIQTIEEYNMQDRVIMASFDDKVVNYFRERSDEEIMTGSGMFEDMDKKNKKPKGKKWSTIIQLAIGLLIGIVGGVYLIEKFESGELAPAQLPAFALLIFIAAVTAKQKRPSPHPTVTLSKVVRRVLPAGKMLFGPADNVCEAVSLTLFVYNLSGKAPDQLVHFRAQYFRIGRSYPLKERLETHIDSVAIP